MPIKGAPDCSVNASIGSEYNRERDGTFIGILLQKLKENSIIINMADIKMSG